MPKTIVYGSIVAMSVPMPAFGMTWRMNTRTMIR